MIVKDPCCGMPVDPEKTKFKTEVWGRKYYFCSEHCMHRFLEESNIGYFSMEIGLKSEIPTYSGGLGVLAGDTVRSSADLRIPLIAVTLASRRGYLKQKLAEDGEQTEYPDEWDPSQYLDPLPAKVNLRISGREVKVGTWLYEHRSPTGGIVFVLFLDTDNEANAPEDRRITDYLYGGDERYRLKQEIVLGIGGVRMLKALGLTVKRYHINEGHSSLLTMELLKEEGMDPDRVRDLCVFTTHTPVEAAMDSFSYDIVSDLLEDGFSFEALRLYGGEDKLNMTRLALNLSKYVNGVSQSNMEYSNKLSPGHHIRAITNGVHSHTWTSSYFRDLFDKYIRGWVNEPALLTRAEIIPDNEIWDAHMKAKKSLLNLVQDRTGVVMDADRLTIGFARRATGYKRATLIFSDIQRLRRVNRRGELQLIFSGKAHPRDLTGKSIIKEIFGYARQLEKEIKIVYLENYDMGLAAKLVAGVDVWLNTPLPPLEASGTSGMKAAHNGVINFSVLDGWWIEGWVEDLTGWSIGPLPDEPISERERRTQELNDLYGKLEYSIIPRFYEEKDAWIDMMENSIGKVAYYFNSHRMMRRYVLEAYL